MAKTPCNILVEVPSSVLRSAVFKDQVSVLYIRTRSTIMLNVLVLIFGEMSECQIASRVCTAFQARPLLTLRPLVEAMYVPIYLKSLNFSRAMPFINVPSTELTGLGILKN